MAHAEPPVSGPDGAIWAAADLVLGWPGGAAACVALAEGESLAWQGAPGRTLLLLLRGATGHAQLTLGDALAWQSARDPAWHLLPAGLAGSGLLRGPLHATVLAYDPAGLPRPAPKPVLDAGEPGVAELLAALESPCRAVDADAAAAVARRIAERLAERPARIAEPGLQTWRLRRLRAFVEERLAEPLTLRDLAGAAGLSPFHFARGFTRATGVPPFTYLRQRRCARARELLLGSALPIAEIAQRCGFRSQSHFTAVFQRAEGVPPGRFRREAQRSPRLPGATRAGAAASP